MSLRFFRSVPSIVFVALLATNCSPSESSGSVEAQAETAKRHARIIKMSAAWPIEPQFIDTLNALTQARMANGLEGSRPMFDPDDEYWGLPRTGAYDLVDLSCSSCHTLQIVMQQRATPERWNYMLDWMVEKQGMAVLPEDERAAILEYLSTHFGTN